MPNEQEKFNTFLEEEFNLLINREYNRVINDLKDVIDIKKEDILDSIEKKKTLFSNYTELILYADVNNVEVEDYLKFDYVTLYGILGEAYFQREMYIEAINALDNAISMSPANILLLQRKMNALKKLNLIDDLESLIFKTFKYCYTRDTLINQYLFLSYVYERKGQYKDASYILYLVGVAFESYDKLLPEIDRIQNLTKEKYICPDFDTLMNFLKEKNIITPYDLSTYYFSFYNEMMKNNDALGALDFLRCSNNVCYDKRNMKMIKKLTKAIEKQKKKANLK